MSRKILCRYLLGVFVLIFTTAMMAPFEFQISHEDLLIARTKNIALATVVSAELIDEKKCSVLYKFKTQRMIKGEKVEFFTVEGIYLSEEHELNDFNNHTDELFWEKGLGRLFPSEDSIIYPMFGVGGDYLVFIDEPYHVRSFEHIKSVTTDKWLIYVQDKVKEQAAKQTQPEGPSKKSNAE